MNDNEFMEMAKEKIKGIDDPDKVIEILDALPEGKKVTLKFKYKGETLKATYKQKTRANMFVLHGLDVIPELKKLAIQEYKQKKGKK